MRAQVSGGGCGHQQPARESIVALCCLGQDSHGAVTGHDCALRRIRRSGRIQVTLVLGTAALAGCGGNGTGASDAARPSSANLSHCSRIEHENNRFLICRRHADPSDRGSFFGRGRGPIPIAYPSSGDAGHWSGAFVSPDGRTLLLQWIAECEVPFALFVDASGGTPRLVLGERRIEDARPSIAHG